MGESQRDGKIKKKPVHVSGYNKEETVGGSRWSVRFSRGRDRRASSALVPEYRDEMYEARVHVIDDTGYNATSCFRVLC